jgi:hypothetical protein
MSIETPDRDRAYVTGIPPEAKERVIVSYPDGSRREAEYWLNGQRVGFREYHPTGELAYERLIDLSPFVRRRPGR